MSRFAASVVAAEVGGHTPMVEGIETASSTWARGSFLIFASGKIAIAGTNPRDILGLALSAASGVTDRKLTLAHIIPGLTRLEMSLDSAGGLGTRALAQTDVGAVYGVTLNSGVWYVDVDKTTPGTNTAVRVLALKDPIGATTADTPSNTNTGGGRVIVTLLSDASHLHTAAA